MMANYENTPVDRSITSSMMTRSNYLLSTCRYQEVLIGEFLITLYSNTGRAKNCIISHSSEMGCIFIGYRTSKEK